MPLECQHMNRIVGTGSVVIAGLCRVDGDVLEVGSLPLHERGGGYAGVIISSRWMRQWSLEDGEMREPKKAHARPHDCPRCYTVFYGRVCPHCQHAEPMAEVNQVETELEDASTGVPAKAKTGNRRNDLWRDVAIAKKAPDPRRALLAVAERRGYKPGWAEHILRAWSMAA